jgi:hypothetical protein
MISVEHQQIIDVLKQAHAGFSMTQIQERLHSKLHSRTTLRRIKELINTGFIQSSGSRSGTRYFLADPVPQAPTQVIDNNEPVTVDPASVSLSKEATEIHQLVSRPKHQRPLVAYHREFLDQYIPGKTWYLTAAEREHLRQIGQRTPIVQEAGTYAKQILERLLIDLSWNSSRLEGNTYSLLDTEKLLAEGLLATEKSAIDAQMILNHKEAIEFLANSADEIGFNRYTITNLHGLLANNLLPDEGAPGRLRFQPIGIGLSVYTPTAIPQLIEELFDIVLDKASAIGDPFEQAFFAMVHLPYLQPFDDVNKRVSRLAANIPFFKQNLAPLSFTDVPRDLYIKGLLGVYELNRPELLRNVFLWAYERSAARYTIIRQTIGEPDPFRMRYREIIGATVREAVMQQLPPSLIDAFIHRASEQIPPPDNKRFSKIITTELNTLHEGNIARYKISLAEFRVWKKIWKK